MTVVRQHGLGGAAALLACAFVATPVLADTLGGAKDPPIAWWRVFAALLLCLVLAVGAALALRVRMRGLPASRPAAKASLTELAAALWRKLPSGGNVEPGELQLLESIRLSHQIDVCRIRFRDEDYLVAASAQGLVLLGKAPAASKQEAEAQ